MNLLINFSVLFPPFTFVVCYIVIAFVEFQFSRFRYIAVTQPIKYAKHKNSTRIFVTILLVWAISIAIGSPIVLGLNNTPNRVPDLCAFFNSNFIIFSSMVSFYIPCIVMMFLYWSIFKVSANIYSHTSHTHAQSITANIHLAFVKRHSDTFQYSCLLKGSFREH